MFTGAVVFPPELRRVIYTTNSIESLNFQLDHELVRNERRRGEWLAQERRLRSPVSWRVGP